MSKSIGCTTKYLIVNERDKLFGLYVNTVGKQDINPGAPYPPVEHPSGYYFSAEEGRILHEYQLVYITQGNGTFCNRNQSPQAIVSGQALLLLPGQWHTYSPSDKTGWKEYYIGFKGSIIENLIKNEFLAAENQVLDLGLNEEIVALFTRALDIANEDKTGAQQQLGGIVLHLLGLVLSISKNRLYEQDNTGKKIERAKIYMREHLSSDIDWEQLSSKLNTSYSWFRKVFKEYTGYAPAKYHQELKLHKAKEWLVETNSTIKEIAYNLGFSNAEHFFAMFKKSTGLTPTEFRRSGRK